MERYVGKHQKEPGHQTRDTASPVDNVRSPEPTDLMAVPDEVVDQGLPRPLLDNAAGSVAWRYTREPVRRGGP